MITAFNTILGGRECYNNNNPYKRCLHTEGQRHRSILYRKVTNKLCMVVFPSFKEL